MANKYPKTLENKGLSGTLCFSKYFCNMQGLVSKAKSKKGDEIVATRKMHFLLERSKHKRTCHTPLFFE